MIYFDLISEGPPKAKKAALKRGMKTGLEAGLDYWLLRLRQLHFSARAHTLYGARRRSAKHNTRKFKRFGHRKPNVWTGESERRSRYMRQTVTSGKRTGTRATGRFPDVPAYFWKYRANAPDSGRELVAIARREPALLLRVAVKCVMAEVKKADRVKTRRRIR